MLRVKKTYDNLNDCQLLTRKAQIYPNPFFHEPICHFLVESAKSKFKHSLLIVAMYASLHLHNFRVGRSRPDNYFPESETQENYE